MRRPDIRDGHTSTRPRRGIVIGYPYYAKRLARLMSEHSTHWTMRAFGGHRWDSVRTLMAIRNSDVVVCFGGPAPDPALAELARRYGIPVVVVWAGSDVIYAAHHAQDLQVIKEAGFHHIADGAWLVDELAVLGLDAEYEPLTDVSPGKPVRPFPTKFSVLTHLPRPRRAFYGEEVVYEVARRMPDVFFTVVGDGGASGKAPENVRFCGYVADLQEHIDESTVILRVPEHDGKSMLVLEALARARHVVWNYEFDHVICAKTVDDIVSALTRLRDLHRRNALPLNTDGREYVLRHFNREKVAHAFEARLDALVGREQSSSSTKRVAISGLSIFCADVASYVRQIAPEWDPWLLRANSRLGILSGIWAVAQCDIWYSIGNPLSDRWVSLAARALRKPRIIHWVGSDILALAEQPHLARKLRRRDILHLAETQWTAEELKQFGISPRIVPLPPRRHYGHCVALPAKFTVLLYVPKTRQEFYGASAFERLMARLSDQPIRYIVVGGGELRIPKGTEAINLGWRNDLRDAYKDATVLVRFTTHDGLSLMVLEALSYGRHVVWTQPFSFVRRARDYHSLEQEILALLEAHRKQTLKPQHQASAFIHRYYSPKSCIAALAQVWNDAGGHKRQLVPPGIRTARADAGSVGPTR